MNVRMNRGLGLNILVVLFLAVALFTAGCINEDTTSSEAPLTELADTSGVSEAGDYVEVDYTGTLTDGTLFDSSIGYEPLGFVLASQSMIPGFDAAAHGMAVGETKVVTIPSEDAYGAWSEDMILEIPRNIEAEEEEPPVAGDYIYLFTGMGFAPAVVLEVTDEMMIVDANHQLAGQDLVFEITMVKIVKPDDPEHPANAVEPDDIPLQEFIIEVPEAEAAE